MALNTLPAAQPREKFHFQPWMFAVILAVVLVVGAIIVGYLRSKNSSAASTTNTTAASSAATQPVQTVTTSGNDIVNQTAFDDLESNLGTTFTALQNSNAQVSADAGQIGTLTATNQGLTATNQSLTTSAAALQSQIAQLQAQLASAQRTGQDVSALKAQIEALQDQLQALAKRPAPTPTPTPTPAPAPAPAPAPTPAPTAAPPPAQPNGSYYTVNPWPQAGSSLWSIAQIEYGNGALWPRIYQANPSISNPNVIYPGQRIFVPR